MKESTPRKMVDTIPAKGANKFYWEMRFRNLRTDDRGYEDLENGSYRRSLYRLSKAGDIEESGWVTSYYTKGLDTTFTWSVSGGISALVALLGIAAQTTPIPHPSLVADASDVFSLADDTDNINWADALSEDHPIILGMESYVDYTVTWRAP